VRVLHSFPDRIGKPGIGVTAYHQVRETALNGVDVTLYCTSLGAELPPNVTVVETLSAGGRRVPHRALGVERSYRYHDLRVSVALRRLGSSVDLVHCWPRATLRTADVAATLGIPCLREVPNTHTAHAVEVVAREAAALGLPPARDHSHTIDGAAIAREELEYERATGLLVPSEYSLETFGARGVAREKLLLHRYGYAPDRFFARSGARRAGASLNAIFVGRCEPRKGLHHALRAWIDSGAADSGGRFLVCGSFEPGYRELLDPLLAHPSVEVTGFTSDPAALMRESDVLVLPSLEEGSALVSYEAQACGCVLAVSDAAGARCRDGIEGLVHTAGDVEALTGHLRRLQTDRALLLRLREASLTRIGELSWAAAGAELAAIYAQQVAVGRPSPSTFRYPSPAGMVSE
jgi:glycosyltransferase involved in cell wall biosynthesis